MDGATRTHSYQRGIPGHPAVALAIALGSLSACGGRTDLIRPDASQVDVTRRDEGHDIEFLDAARDDGFETDRPVPDVTRRDTSIADTSDNTMPPVDVVAIDSIDQSAPDVAIDIFDAPAPDMSVCTPAGYAPAVAYPYWDPLAEHPTFVTTGDFDHDGHIDIAATGGASPAVGGELQGRLYFNRGDGTFGAQIPFMSGPWPNEVVSADFDRDGWLDLASADTTERCSAGCCSPGCSSSVAIVYNHHDGTFSAPTYVSTGGFASFSLAAGDLDHNGTLDIVVTNQSHPQLAIILSSDGVHFAAPQGRVLTDIPSYVRLADLDANGTLDVVYSVRSRYPVELRTLLNDGTGALTAGATYPIGPAGSYSSGDSQFALGDYDANGSIDVVVPGPGIHQLSLLRNRGDGTFGSPEMTELPATPIGLVSVDADVNGTVDLGVLLARWSTGGRESVGMLANDGHGSFAAPVEAVDFGPSHLAAADFNEDGFADFVTGNTSWVGVVLSQCR